MDRYKTLSDEVKRLATACGRNADEVTLIAVSKTYPVEAIMQVYQAGCRDFGESRVQEALQKLPGCPSDLRWHFIGTLQANKVRKVVGRFALIHSVDSPELASRISTCSVEADVTSRILLQVNTSGETSKHGLSIEAWKSEIDQVLTLPHVCIEGLMTMAPLTEDVDLIRSSMSRLRQFRDELGLKHLSMGMSHDYPIAIEEGATFLRIGTAIFEGRREILQDRQDG